MARLVALLKHLFPEDTIHEFYTAPAIPYQTDAFNCGVYVCMYAYHWLQRGTLPTTTDFSRFDCPAFRSFMSQTLAKAVRSLTESIAKKYPHAASFRGFSCHANSVSTAFQYSSRATNYR